MQWERRDLFQLAAGLGDGGIAHLLQAPRSSKLTPMSRRNLFPRHWTTPIPRMSWSRRAAGGRKDRPEGFYSQILRFDLRGNQVRRWFEDGCYPGEPVFVPRPGGANRLEGVIVSVVLDGQRSRSFLLVLDARNFEEVGRAFALAYAVLALIGYAHSGYSWWLFAALILVPDLSMLGYLISPSIGAASYNLVHTLTLPILLLCVAVLFANMLLLAIGTIWFVHIGADRALGYGLKYATGFGDTHLSVPSQSPTASR
jgi:hypothetical protein